MKYTVDVTIPDDPAMLVSLWNSYCDQVGNMDDHIFCMYELDALMDGMSPTEIIDCIDSNMFCTHDDYFVVDNDDWVSFDDPTDYIDILKMVCFFNNEDLTDPALYELDE